ncbi:MAG: hypothetical protein RL017_172 [Pseudomonadota bacterium]|jgi:transposase
MFIDSSKTIKNGKTYIRHTLRNSYWDKEARKVRHINIANLTKYPEAEINAIKLALKHKDNLAALIDNQAITLKQGKSFGAVHVINEVANRLGIVKAINAKIKDSKQAKLALWQIIARCIYQGSKLKAYRMSKHHALEEIIGLTEFSRDDIYDNLNVILEQRNAIEKQLFKQHSKCSSLFLYDVTSSYLEGVCNEYAQYGYNRDKKAGKEQIVIGLLTNEAGVPVASRVFEGNTVDTKTVGEQIKLLADEFNVKNITLVGDRGMLKTPQINSLPDGFSFITAITKSQIMTMINKQVIRYELFDEDLTEVVHDNMRYILRLNPIRRDEIRVTRQSKLDKLNKMVVEQNEYLKIHTKAKISTAVQKLNIKLTNYNLEYITIDADESSRRLSLIIDQQKLQSLEQLDGCYCLKTDILDLDKELIHQRYKDLAKVESAFRCMKTECLEIRPIYVRKKTSTDAHVFIVTLAYMIIQELEKIWYGQQYTISEILDIFNTMNYMEVDTGGNSFIRLPTPTAEIQKFIDLAKITLPTIKNSYR